MIRLRSEYDKNEESGWRLIDKVGFLSGKKGYYKSAYHLTPPQSYYGVNSFCPKYLGAKPHTIGATCLTVWSK